MKKSLWDETKNKFLKDKRGISFEDILEAMSNGELMDVVDHPNQKKYRGQKIFVVSFNHYVYYVPFVENDTEVFLKTIVPSRKLHKQYKEPL